MTALGRMLIIGHPLGHTLSPLMHNTAFQELGLPYYYEAEDVPPEGLAEAVERFRAEGVVGLSVTIPHKEAILPFLDEVDEEVERLGAANTVVLVEGRFVGTNTDGIGFMRSLKENGGYDPEGRSAVVLGAGGAARAVAAHLALSGADSVVIANRTLSRAERLATDLARAVGRQCFEPLPLEATATAEAIRQADCLINATSVGMAGDRRLPVPAALIEPHLVVCDIVYRPLVTPLLEAALARGASIINGLGMLVYQGAEAFRRWTGQEMPIDIVRSTLEAALELEGPESL
ncbi:MAG: shikimate dehydrogenase [Nitrospinae bacterium]|nr:shikimate dehydrogenase [Nitrospinota bacterium]